MYNSKSKKATEFIDDAEIRRTLAFAEENKNNLEMVRDILKRAEDCKGLNYRDAISKQKRRCLNKIYILRIIRLGD